MQQDTHEEAGYTPFARAMTASTISVTVPVISPLSRVCARDRRHILLLFHHATPQVLALPLGIAESQSDSNPCCTTLVRTMQYGRQGTASHWHFYGNKSPTQLLVCTCPSELRVSFSHCVLQKIFTTSRYLVPWFLDHTSSV